MARRTRNSSCGRPSSEMYPAQLPSTSWSSSVTTHGAAACAACRSGSVLVQRVPGAVLVQREDLAGEVDRDSLVADAGRRTDADLVDVVAEEQHDVVVPSYDVLVRRVVPVVEGLAGRDRHRHRGLVGRRRRGPSTSDRTDLTVGAEAVEVVPPRSQTADVDVHGVGVLRPSVGRAASYHSAERARPRRPPSRRPPCGRPSRRTARAGPVRAGSRSPRRPAVGSPEATPRVNSGRLSVRCGIPTASSLTGQGGCR